MARQIGFHFYSVQVRTPYAALETLSNLPSNTAGQPAADALTLLSTGLEDLIAQQHVDDPSHRVCSLLRCETVNRNITGLLEAGHYGETATIVNSRTRQTTHRQTLIESSLLPCFFRLVIPHNDTRALLVLQRDNRVPAKQGLQSIFTRLFRAHNPDLGCSFVPVANQATFARLVNNGEVQELRFIRLLRPQDIFDKYGRNGRLERPGTAELIHRAPKGGFLPAHDKLIRLLRGDTPTDVFEFPEFPFERIKAKVRVGNRLQTVDFGRGMSQPIMDVTDRVTLDRATGRPTYESLAEVTVELAASHDLTT